MVTATKRCKQSCLTLMIVVKLFVSHPRWEAKFSRPIDNWRRLRSTLFEIDELAGNLSGALSSKCLLLLSLSGPLCARVRNGWVLNTNVRDVEGHDDRGWRPISGSPDSPLLTEILLVFSLQRNCLHRLVVLASRVTRTDWRLLGDSYVGSFGPRKENEGTL